MDLRRVREYDVLALTAPIRFLGKFVRYAFPPLFEPLQAGYGVIDAAVGAAFSGFMTVYRLSRPSASGLDPEAVHALAQFPSGWPAAGSASFGRCSMGPAALAAAGLWATA